MDVRELVKLHAEFEHEAFNPLIVCAACRFGDVLLIAPRHMHPLMHMQAEAYGIKMTDDCEQGFIDQRGRFYDREEAWKIAEKNGQIREQLLSKGTLYSENLY